MYRLNKRGQNTVEYVLLVAAVIAVMILFSRTTFQAQLNSTLNTSVNQMNREAGTMVGRFIGGNPAAGARPEGFPLNMTPNMETN